MAEFSLQGVLSTSGTVLYTGNGTDLSKIIVLRFNNPAAYGLKLEKFEFSTSSTIVIYDLTLAAGDTVTDNFMYALNPGDQLIATSTVAGTTYYAYGTNYIDNADS
jgi:hypothetical protein